VVSSPALAEMRDQNARILQFLAGEQARAPDGSAPDAYQLAVRYAIGRYEGRLGLEHYSAALERIGFAGKEHALDIGSGAGHWCFAFLPHRARARAFGIDRDAGFAELATSIAREIGVAERASFCAERAEDAVLEAGTFDCAWAHSVLMYTDQEKVVRNVADALAMNGGFYCGYTGEGARLQALHVSLAAGLAGRAVISLAGEDRPLTGRLEILFDAYVQRCGVARTAPQMLQLDDLLRMCRIFGMEFVDRPEVQDGPRDYLGFPSTFDFVVRKVRAPDEARRRLLGREAVETTWSADLEAIARSGCPSLVCDVCEAVDPASVEEELRHIYARALIRAGRADSEQGRRIFDDGLRPLPDHIMGLYWHTRRDYAAALAAYRKLPDDKPGKAFLQGECLLRMKEFQSAEQVFARAIEAGRAEPREWIGLVAAHDLAGDRTAATAAFRGFIESRRAAGIPEPTIATELARLEPRQALQ
jgi:SAM-dependent methyltransferase